MVKKNAIMHCRLYLSQHHLVFQQDREACKVFDAKFSMPSIVESHEVGTHAAGAGRQKGFV
jgi:hypothetical protein